MKLEEFAKKHRKEIMEWQEWFRKQSGKTIAEIDKATEAQFFHKKSKRPQKFGGKDKMGFPDENKIKIKLSKRQTEGFKNGFIIEIGVACKKCGRTLVIKVERDFQRRQQVGRLSSH
jgi:hypothetical protein